MKHSAISFFLCLITALCAYADQVIYIDVADFIPDDSQFGVDVKGNEWIEVADPDALDGQAFGGPGDSNYTADGGNPFLVAEPYLIIIFPEDVKQGESTANGKTWVPWARMRVPSDQNSFYWQVSGDRPFDWKPDIITNAVRWNNDAVNGTNEWYWQDNLTGNDGGINADIEVGVNYVRIGVRESDPVTFPLIDVICFRNDGEQPSDEEAEQYVKAVRPQEPETKSTPNIGTWGAAKHSPVVYIAEQHVDIDTTFNVDVRIKRAENMAGFQVSLNYDTYRLQFIGIQEGNALSKDGLTTFWRDPDIDTETGIIVNAASIITGAGGVNVEDDALMILTFKAKEVGRTRVSFQEIKISDPDSKSLPFRAISAFIDISPPWDVVPDSVIDVLDMVAVGQHLDNSQFAALFSVQGDVESIPDTDEYNPDVDRNGTVNVDDLILVSNHFGEVYNDSDADQQLSPRAEILRAYDMINAAPYGSPDIRKLQVHLTWLLAMDRATSLSASNRLLPNYPNPFNPDTWLPYYLAYASDVTISIYSASGQLVRRLNLGHREAGFYTARGKAVRWDGRNHSGEELASGLYFYVMRAGDFTATRKMLLVE